MAEFRQMWLPAKNGQRVHPKRIPPPHLQPQAAVGEPPPELGRPRHTQLTAGPKCKHSGTSVPAPGATRPRLGNPRGPRTGGDGRTVTHLEEANPPGLGLERIPVSIYHALHALCLAHFDVPQVALFRTINTGLDVRRKCTGTFHRHRRELI